MTDSGETAALSPERCPMPPNKKANIHQGIQNRSRQAHHRAGLQRQASGGEFGRVPDDSAQLEEEARIARRRGVSR